MPILSKTPLWTWPVRLVLAAIWLVHGLEKFGVKWPHALAGGTHSVPSMLDLMHDETPVAAVRALLGWMLPVGQFLQIPVGLLELTLAVLIATGLGLRWATLIGLGMQTFFWLGFLSLDWPLMYPLVMLAHAALGAPYWLPRVQTRDHWLQLPCFGAAVLWLYAGASGGSLALMALGLLLAVGSRIRLAAALASLVAFWPLVLAYQANSWGDWPWVYYLLGAMHLGLLLDASGEALALVRRPIPR